jgi:hypothetical protein
MITRDEDLKWMHSDAASEIDKGTVFLPVFQAEEIRSSALRTYASGDRLLALTMLYNADEKALAGSEIEMQYILYKDGAEFRRSEPSPVSPNRTGNLEGIPISLRLTMDSTLPPGDYVLELLVTDRRNIGRREGSATQIISFTVVDNPSPEQLTAPHFPKGQTTDDVRTGNPSLEQLVARHLESIGEPGALSQIESMAFTGTAEVRFIQGWFGGSDGAVILVSQGPKMAMVMDFPNQNYRGEYFSYDGKTVTVRNLMPGVNSPIAAFIHLYDRIMKNGLLGGVYSNAWPLLNIDRNGADMRVRKTRMEGTELYEIEYRPKDNHRNMRIRLYFDPETYRHVRTHYYLSNASGFSTRPTLTEIFEDFKKVENLILPHSYTLHLEDWQGHIARWKIEASEWIFNRPDIDLRIFQAEN